MSERVLYVLLAASALLVVAGMRMLVGPAVPSWRARRRAKARKGML